MGECRRRRKYAKNETRTAAASYLQVFPESKIVNLRARCARDAPVVGVESTLNNRVFQKKGGTVLSPDLYEMTFDLPGLGTMRISRLEYQSVREDGLLPSGGFVEVDGLYRVSAPDGGNGMDGIVHDPAHWAVCLFPRDAHGDVAGWFMSFDTRAALVDSLRDGIWAIVAISLQ